MRRETLCRHPVQMSVPRMLNGFLLVFYRAASAARRGGSRKTLPAQILTLQYYFKNTQTTRKTMIGGQYQYQLIISAMSKIIRLKNSAGAISGREGPTWWRGSVLSPISFLRKEVPKGVPTELPFPSEDLLKIGHGDLPRPVWRSRLASVGFPRKRLLTGDPKWPTCFLLRSEISAKSWKTAKTPQWRFPPFLYLSDRASAYRTLIGKGILTPRRVFTPRRYGPRGF